MKKFIDSFWAKVERRGPEECWPWTASLYTQTGYGQFWAGATRKSGVALTTTAHRFSWELANGRPAPKGSEVRHSCHNRSCVNPAHLSLGTHADNARDMVEAGRSAKLSNHSQTHLSNDDVQAIRHLSHAGDISQTAIGQLFGIAQQTVSRIAHGKTWGALPMERH